MSSLQSATFRPSYSRRIVETFDHASEALFGMYLEVGFFATALEGLGLWMGNEQK